MAMTRRLALAGALVLGTSGIAIADNEEGSGGQSGDRKSAQGDG
jgi:hypothetical protein